MILVGLRDVGAVNVCLPVIEKLSDWRFPWYIYAEGVAYERLKDGFTFITTDPIDNVFDSLNPSLVVATCATKGGDVPINLTEKAKRRNLPVVLVEDMWSAHSAFTWDILPDEVCVTDEFSKSLVLMSWPNYPEFHIHITGTPVFDKCIDVDTEAAKHKLRTTLNLNESWPIVFFPGTGLVSGMAEVIQMLVIALNSLHIPVYLILRDHPSVPPSETLKYREALGKLKIGRVIDSSKLNSNEVNAGSDIIVGTFSTMTVEACYMRKPVLIIWTPEISRVLMEATSTLSEWPITNLGAAFKAKNVYEIMTCLGKIISGCTSEMIQAQQKHFLADGLSANRIAKTIVSYYR